MFLGGGGGAGGWKEGGGHSETNQSLSRRGLGFCAERCHPQTRAAQSTLSRRTDIEALGETRRQKRAGYGLSALPHTCALRSVRSGQWGGSGFGGKADPEVCECLVVPQHRPVHTAAFWWWRRGGGGGAYLSNAEVPGGQAHGAWDEWFTNTRRPGGGRPHALRPKSTAPTTAAEVGGGAGTIHTNTCSGSACVALPLAEAWHMVLAAPALGHQQRCGTLPNPKSSAPTTAEARRRRGRVGRRYSTKTPTPVTCSARDLIKTLGFAPTPHDNSDPEPRRTNAAACTARSCGAAQAYPRDSQTSTSCCFSKPR